MRPRLLVILLLVLGLLPVVAGGAAASTPGSRPAPEAGPAPDVVRLARVGGSVVRTAQVPLTGSVRLRADGFAMVAVTWRDPARRHPSPLGSGPLLRVRVAGAGGWRAWRKLLPLADGPRTSRLRGSEALWVGSADRVDLRVVGSGFDDLTLVLIDPGRMSSDHPAYDVPAARRARPGDPRAPKPWVRTRGAWGAPERWRAKPARYNRTIQQIHLHHTASGNTYRRRDVPALLRGMYRYHARILGWSDLGYNFLVDRFGRAWVGRAGGAGRPVRGAHTLGFNETSVGISVIGTFSRTRPRPRVVRTIVKLAAWKLDRYGRRPGAYVRVFSHGSDRYPRGRGVRLPVIDGHRDTNLTECPGLRLYRLLPRIRRLTAHRVAKRW